MAVTHFATGAKSAGGTTTVSIASPASTAAGQMLLAFRAAWVSSISFTDETDWTASGSLAGGTGSSTDAHTGAIRADRRLLAGSLAGPTVFDQTNGGSAPGAIGIMLSYENDGGTWDVATGTGDDATHGTNRSVTTSGTIDLAVDDVVVVAFEVDTDTSLAAFANPAITASGITFGSTTRRTSGAGVTTGADGNIEVLEATVTSGSGTVAVTAAFETSTTQCGPAVFVRLRELETVTIDTTAPVLEVRAATTSVCVDGFATEILTTSGTWDWAAAGSPSTVEVWVIAGGAGGGPAGAAVGAGGGAAGGVEHDASFAVSGDIDYTIGAAGAGGLITGPVDATDGGDSVWDTGGTPLTADGGGAGGGLAARPTGNNGGSGGGGRGSSGAGAAGGTATAGQGNNGGTGFGSPTNTNRAGGGGGGQSTAGATAVSDVGGDGGDGLDLSAVVGTSVGDSGWFAAGGGGGVVDAADTPGAGGAGGGGAGGADAAGADATAYGSGGGGGADTNDGGDGFQGAIILRYACGDAQPVTINTEAAILEVRAGVTTLTLGEAVVDTEAARLWVQAATTTLTLGEKVITTEAARINLRAAVTTVDASGVVVDTTAARLWTRAGVTTIELGATTISTEAARLWTRAGVTSVELGETVIQTEAARLHVRAGVTAVIAGRQFVPQVECALVVLPVTATTTILTTVCEVTSLPVECEIVDGYGQNH